MIYLNELDDHKNGEDFDTGALLLPLMLQEFQDISPIIRRFKMESDFDGFYDIIHCRNISYRIFPELPNRIQDKSTGIVRLKALKGIDSIRPDFKKVLENLQIFKETGWTNLYKPETALNKNLWKKFISNKDLVPASTEALEYYIHWWLEGIDKKRIDPNESMKETGVRGSLDDVCADEWEKFYDLFPVFYFSLTYIASLGIRDDLIERVAIKLPDGVPYYEGYDLWLQRTALHLMVKKNGLHFLNKFWSMIRFEAIYNELFKCCQIEKNGVELINIIENYYSFLSDKDKVLVDEENEESPGQMLLRLKAQIVNP
ncbi:MAG: hypothetical protein C4518_03325 [Desulfobacteraceae bacterium]|nr:MAG: hypothetical protein C4518_03325 [Desulfobacteraceae bacterium]